MLLWSLFAADPSVYLDSDMSSELVLSELLSREGGILTTKWYYSTELRVLNTQLVFSALFRISDNWRFVRLAGAVLLLLLLLVCCRYFCCQLGLRRCFPAVAGVLQVPFLWSSWYILYWGSFYIPHLCITFLAVGAAFHCGRAPKGWRRTGLFALALGLAFAAGLGGLRQLLICYLPAALAALGLAAYERFSPRGTPQRLTPPAIPVIFTASLAAALAGYLVNSRYLARSHSFASFSSLSFTSFSLSKLETYLCGWLNSFGYHTGTVFSGTLLYDLCFGMLLLTLFFCLRTLWRHQAQYPPEHRFLLFFCVLAFLLYTCVILFSDFSYTERYNCPIAVLFIPPTVIVLARYRSSFSLRAFCAALMAVLSLLTFVSLSPMWKEAHAGSDRQSITEFLLANDYRTGYVTEFWNGNVFTELSNGRIDMRMLSVNKLEPDNLNNTFHWLQCVDHDTTVPTGKVFVLFTVNEPVYQSSAPSLGEENIVYTTGPYILYGFDSYDALVEQLSQPLPPAPDA